MMNDIYVEFKDVNCIHPTRNSVQLPSSYGHSYELSGSDKGREKFVINFSRVTLVCGYSELDKHTIFQFN
jgi:hypothetical protein